MITKKTVHIALGSNKGDKYKHLQDAINNIFISIGSVKQIGKIYKTKALDFDGYDFYNTCISVTTTLSALDVLYHLQQIEKKLGRQKTLEDSYENREIDLDIILFENDIIETPKLTIPHLEAHNRKFVLQPLRDIAKDVIHPKLNKSITDLLEICKDDSAPEPQNIWLKKPKKQYNLKTHNYIAIEGNIGAGKTSLTHLIAEEFNAKPILERFADNPFFTKILRRRDKICLHFRNVFFSR